eukprot:m51a1_g4847 putative tyrosine (923) ;mRNA; f:250075-254191
MRTTTTRTTLLALVLLAAGPCAALVPVTPCSGGSVADANVLLVGRLPSGVAPRDTQYSKASAGSVAAAVYAPAPGAPLRRVCLMSTLVADADVRNASRATAVAVTVRVRALGSEEPLSAALAPLAEVAFGAGFSVVGDTAAAAWAAFDVDLTVPEGATGGLLVVQIEARERGGSAPVPFSVRVDSVDHDTPVFPTWGLEMRSSWRGDTKPSAGIPYLRVVQPSARNISALARVMTLPIAVAANLPGDTDTREWECSNVTGRTVLTVMAAEPATFQVLGGSRQNRWFFTSFNSTGGQCEVQKGWWRQRSFRRDDPYDDDDDDYFVRGRRLQWVRVNPNITGPFLHFAGSPGMPFAMVGKAHCGDGFRNTTAQEECDGGPGCFGCKCNAKQRYYESDYKFCLRRYELNPFGDCVWCSSGGSDGRQCLAKCSHACLRCDTETCYECLDSFGLERGRCIDIQNSSDLLFNDEDDDDGKIVAIAVGIAVPGFFVVVVLVAALAVLATRLRARSKDRRKSLELGSMPFEPFKSPVAVPLVSTVSEDHITAGSRLVVGRSAAWNVDPELIDFGLGNGQADVGVRLVQEVSITNSGKRRMTFHAPCRSTGKYSIVCKPTEGVLRAGRGVVVAMYMELYCTTSVKTQLPIGVEYEEGGRTIKEHRKVDVVVESKLSTRIDIDEVRFGDTIGEGAYGVVYSGAWRGNNVAIKQLKIPVLGFESQAVKDFEREVDNMERLRSPQIIHFYEFCPLGSLGAFMKQNNLLWYFRLKCALDCARGMNGLGTPIYMAPEVLEGSSNYTKAADVYSFAVVMWELCSEKEPYEGQAFSSFFQIEQFIISGNRLEFPSGYPEAYERLVVDSWNSDPEKRPAFDKIAATLEGILAQEERPDSSKAVALKRKESSNKQAMSAPAMNNNRYVREDSPRKLTSNN